MNTTRRFGFILLAAVLLASSFSSCDSLNKKDQGVIYYDVSFPFLENSILKNVFPEELELTFKGDRARAEMQSLGGIVMSGFISDQDEKTLTQVLKSYQNFHQTTLNLEQVESFLSSQPGVNLEPQPGRVEEVAGYLCQVTIAHFKTDSVPPIELYHTDAFDLENPNWFTHYKDIPGVLLGYEIEQFGMRMKLRARNVMLKPIDDTDFDVDPKFQSVSDKEMQDKFTSLLEEFE